jgi:hypothetical protein
LDTVKETGTYIFRSVTLYNSRPDVRVPIVFVRVCLVSADCEPISTSLTLHFVSLLNAKKE